MAGGGIEVSEGVVWQESIAFLCAGRQGYAGRGRVVGWLPGAGLGIVENAD